MREYAGVVQRLRVIGGRLEHAAIELVSFHELIIFLKLDGERHRLVER